MLTLSQASSIVDHALAYARAHDLAPMTIAALDARGCLVALKMEDGSGLMRPDIAAGKAWGALGMGFGTRNLAGRAQSSIRSRIVTEASSFMSIISCQLDRVRGPC